MRLTPYRRVERRRGLSPVVKVLLAVPVALLSVVILLAASGAVGPAVSGVVKGFGGLLTSVSTVVSSPAPTGTPGIPDAPTIVQPQSPTTNVAKVDVTVTVPASVVGLDGFSVRLWVTVPDQEPDVLTEVPVGPTSVLVIPGVQLVKGANNLQATVLGPGGESELSPIVTWTLDQSRPAIRITSPRDNSSTTAAAVTIKGKTQGGSTVLFKNELIGATGTAQAGDDGLFQVALAIDPGINPITITATDPAGNPNTMTLTVRGGSGSMQVALTGTAYRFTAKKLPRTVSFTVAVTGPDGARIAGAVALFTVSVPGLEAIVSSETQTDANGTATFTTRIPKGALPGGGLASVLVTTRNYGQATDRQVLTVE